MQLRLPILSRIRSWWHGVEYNFGWHQYPSYLNGPITKMAAFVPIVGYMVLFNDWPSSYFSFDFISNDREPLIFSQDIKIKMLYFGLIFLGLSNLLYRFWRPYPMKVAEDGFEFSNKGIEHFGLGAFLDIHGIIRTDGARTSGGKYYDSEWDGFLALATGKGEGTGHVEEPGNWQAAKSRYEHILRGMLNDWWFRKCTERRKRLLITIFVATLGYLLMSLPSIDLFLSVLMATIYS